MIYKPKKTEHREQSAFFKILELKYKKIYEMTFAIPNGGHRHIAVAVKLKAEGVKAGVPDVFVAIPNNIYRGLFVEFKVSNNKQTSVQKEWEKKLTKNKYHYMVCYSAEEAIKKIIDYIDCNTLIEVRKYYGKN